MIIRCTKCLIPTTRPDTFFADGVCSACIAHERASGIDWGARRKELADLLGMRGRNGSEFDCVVASSGGKDSISQVLDLIELGARPLVVTATTCYLTPVGRYNIDVLKRHATTIEVSPNQRVRALLNRMGLQMVGDISWPEHVAIFTTPMRVAVAMGIPLVFYGENPQRQYGGPQGSEDAKRMTRRWVSEFGGFLGLRPADFIGVDGITEDDMSDYLFPSDDKLEALRAEAHFLGQYLGPWDSHRNAKRAAKIGMRQFLPCEANWWPFENLDNAMTGLHDHMMYRKYGYGRACAQVSVDIRNGLIDRDTGFEIVRQRDGIMPEDYAGVPLDLVLQHLDYTRAQLYHQFERFTNHDLFALYKCEFDIARPLVDDFPEA